MAQPAQIVYERFKRALTLFSKCHHIYNSSQVSDEDIRNLSKCNKVTHAHYNTRFLLTELHVPEFLTFYREAFPGATITPKLHMLEDHVVPWLEKWLVGFGLMGEQGAESMHASFNNMKLQTRYTNNKLEQINRQMTEHFLRVQPANLALQPEIQRRKTY